MPYDFTHMWNLKKHTYKTKQKQTFTYREQGDDCQMGGSGKLVKREKINMFSALP